MSSIKGKKYMEERARHTLYHVCGVALDEWICADKPDLQNEIQSYGIEVVEDCYQNEKKVERFIDSIWDKSFDSIEPQALRRLEKLDGSLTQENGKIVRASLGPLTPNNPTHLIETIQGKIDKLNGGEYEKFDSYGLYVFVDTVFIDENFSSYVQQTMDAVIDIQKEKPTKYDMLYLDQHCTLCICDLVKKTFYHKAIPQEIRELICTEVTAICPN